MAAAVAAAVAAAAAAVIRPSHAEGARNHENGLFIEKLCFRLFLAILGPSRPQKWIRLEISFILVVSGGLYDENKCIS